MRYQIYNNYRKGSNFRKLYVEVQEVRDVDYGGVKYRMVSKYLGKLRKDGTTSVKKRIIYANSRREIIGKLKAKFKHLKKVNDLCYED
jgi:CRP-like cAMP-binding protein